jgi:hypothetical protein
MILILEFNLFLGDDSLLQCDRLSYVPKKEII